MLNKYTIYEEKVSKYVDNLSTICCIAYCIIVCKRFFEFFSEFHDETGFGNPIILNRAQQILENTIISLEGKNIEDAKSILNELDNQIPDSNEWSDCSNAMDAATVHYYSIEFLLNDEKHDIKYIARYCYDYVDRTAQDEMQIDTYSKDNEVKIENHRFVSDEVELNFKIFEELSNAVDNKRINEIVKSYSAVKFSKIQ